ncbi:MAG: winged helix-turn-helix transcriptional regulator [Asgard group archaeon]|nr:winged helix-turn-helix transcriptional regulator [Asgard group archaeon]
MNENVDNLKRLAKTLTIESRVSIYLYLLMYNELTLDKLAKLMNKSKSTIHHHVSELIAIDFIEDYIKPGSKTRYYKLKLLRTDELTEEVYSKESFENLTFQEKVRHLEEYFNIGNMQAKIMQNMFDLVIEQHSSLLLDVKQKEITPEEALEKSNDVLVGTYYSTNENGREFQKELIKLIKKYYTKEIDDPDQVRPRTFLFLGYNLMDILNKKYMR